MSFLINVGTFAVFGGIVIMIINRGNKRRLLGGLLCLVGGLLIIGYASTREVDNDMMGLQVLKNEPQAYAIELHYFNLKTEALKYYQQHGIKDYYLINKFDGDTAMFFDLLKIKQTADGGKQITFLGNPAKKKLATKEFDGFLLRNKLMVLSSPTDRSKNKNHSPK